MVVPDLLATMNRVLSRFRPFCVFSISSGSVVSSTFSSGCPALDPKIVDNTRGARLDPPIPKRTTFSIPLSETSWAKALISGSLFSISSKQSIQPRRFLMASCTSLSLDQRLGSLSKKRLSMAFFSSSVKYAGRTNISFLLSLLLVK